MVEATERLGAVAELNALPEARRGRLQGVVKFVRAEPAGALAVVVLLLIVGLVIVGPRFVSYDPVTINLGAKLRSPGIGKAHLLGTDQLGRDLLSRVLAGGRVSLATATGALALGMLVASLLGVIAGFNQSWLGQVLQRFMDGMMALPPLILALAIAASLGNSATNVLIAISVVMLPSVFRIVRAATLSIRNLDYVQAATALGASNTQVVRRHILPNIIGTIITVASIWVGNVILVEASLGFLGLGTQPPHASWGNMLSAEGRTYMQRAPWMAIVPGVAISLTVLAANMLGDSLRTFLDPKSRRFIK